MPGFIVSRLKQINEKETEISSWEYRQKRRSEQLTEEWVSKQCRLSNKLFARFVQDITGKYVRE